MANKEVRAYQDAVWQFLMEHAYKDRNATDGKEVWKIVFRTPDRNNFENRIKSRLRYGYVRPGFENNWRANKHEDRRYDKKGGKELKRAVEEIEAHESSEETLGTL